MKTNIILILNKINENNKNNIDKLITLLNEISIQFEEVSLKIPTFKSIDSSIDSITNSCMIFKEKTNHLDLTNDSSKNLSKLYDKYCPIK